jgi:hypothetical protein
VPNEPRVAVERAARDLLLRLSELSNPPTLRVADVEGKLACLILVWNVAQAMPTVGAERRRRSGERRAECRADIVEMLRAANRALTRKQVVKALKGAGKEHGPGTVAKALADLTASGELANPKDKKGYRLPDWMKRTRTPSLF